MRLPRAAGGSARGSGGQHQKSHPGRPCGVDRVAAKPRHRRSRRVALTVPNFMLALALIAETDLIGALPRRLVAMHGPRFGVASTEAPLSLQRFQIRAIMPKAAMMDAGLAWLFDLLGRTAQIGNTPRK